MDLYSGCKEKLTCFRIKELKDVLTQLGLSKQGRKQDLVDRILATLSDEQVSKIWPKRVADGKEAVAKLVDDIYRKLQGSEATDLATKDQGGSDSSNVKVKDEMDVPYQPIAKVRCPCGSSSETESMIKCEDLRCQVWQHIDCVIISEKPMEGSAPIPELFYCEICRLIRADPFWVTVAHTLNPVKLTTTSVPSDGTNPVQSLDKSFNITNKDLLFKQDHDVQAWCMLLNDKVPFRMQWPQYADLQINGIPVRAINRPGSQLLGANGRDDGNIITGYTKDGINKISLTGCDARTFCLGVRIVKRRTVEQILNLIPKESDGEHFKDALSRVVRCVGGGASGGEVDSDSDVEVVADSFAVNLRCPMSGSRMKVAGRFKPCVHMGCFDLEVFVELNERSRKWQCPICLKNYSLDDIIIDPYFNRITCKMKHIGEDHNEIEVNPDGSWRAKTRTENERKELGELAQWHAPDGTLCIPTIALKEKLELSKQVKLEGVSEDHTGLRLGFRRNLNGAWEVSKPEESLENHEKMIRMSSSATGTGSEDPSVNQVGAENIDLRNNVIELDSVPLNVDSAYRFNNMNPCVAGEADVIVLSDSEDEIEMLGSSGAEYVNNRNDGGANYVIEPTGIRGLYSEDHRLADMNLYNTNNDEFGMPIWPLAPGSQGETGFQFFSSELDSLQNCYSTLAPEIVLGSTPMVLPCVSQCDTDINDRLVDNPLAFGDEDPSVQIFLPTRPSDGSMQSGTRGEGGVPPNGMRSNDWISLRLGDGASGSLGDAPAENGVTLMKQSSMAEPASLLADKNDSRNEKTSRQRSDSDSHFSVPRQKRSK